MYVLLLSLSGIQQAGKSADLGVFIQASLHLLLPTENFPRVWSILLYLESDRKFIHEGEIPNASFWWVSGDRLFAVNSCQHFLLCKYDSAQICLS